MPVALLSDIVIISIVIITLMIYRDMKFLLLPIPISDCVLSWCGNKVCTDGVVGITCSKYS